MPPQERVLTAEDLNQLIIQYPVQAPEPGARRGQTRTVLNSKGLHVSISGESGKGKSHTMDTMRSLVPSEFRNDGRVSDKALFYMDELHPGTVITLDDVALSDVNKIPLTECHV
jgi:hypothetical protein